MNKHLTDSECSAEHWRAAYMAQTRFHTRHPDEATGWQEWDRQCEVWHRFATQPHAHQET